jgi:hypothetical protein
MVVATALFLISLALVETPPAFENPAVQTLSGFGVTLAVMGYLIRRSDMRQDTAQQQSFGLIREIIGSQYEQQRAQTSAMQAQAAAMMEQASAMKELAEEIKDMRGKQP